MVMNSFYQQTQDDDNKVNFSLGPNFTFPAHFHQKVEIFFLLSGEFGVWKNGKHYTVKSGEIMFFDSYDVHTYDKRVCDVKGLVIIVPPTTAPSFFERKNGKRVVNPLVSDARLCKELYDLSKTYVTDNSLPDTVKSGAVELILSRLETALKFDDCAQSDETTLAQNLLVFINENYQHDLSLTFLGKKFGYSPEHVSRVFHRYLNCGLPKYVNNLRLKHVKFALEKDKKANVTDLLFEAGFKSIQSYYRAKNSQN
ncbi:MAG: AraC family transcriptional regulator [Clostridiales bacterium]|nr:AraC family transcriptional regulator [Clostridiales bacterium]